MQTATPLPSAAHRPSSHTAPPELRTTMVRASPIPVPRRGAATMRSPAALAALLACALLAGGPQARAHGLWVSAHAEGEAVVGQARYSDQGPATGLFIDVLDPASGAVLAQDSSGTDGRFRIAVPPRPAYRVVAEGDEGHRAEAEAVRVAPAGTDPAASDETLRLLRDDIARLERRIRLQDVLGGIGYILGLAGLGAWLMARRRA